MARFFAGTSIVRGFVMEEASVLELLVGKGEHVRIDILILMMTELVKKGCILLVGEVIGRDMIWL